MLALSLRHMSCAVLLFGAPVFADILYASTAGQGGGGVIYRIDTREQSVEEIGHTGFSSVCGIDFNDSGVLYGMGTASGASSILMTIDVEDGSATAIGSIELLQFCSLAFDDSGTLWSVGFNIAINNGMLMKIDPANAGAEFVAFTMGSGNGFVAGMSHRQDGTLFGSRGASFGHKEDLVTVDTKTGELSPIGEAEVDITGIAFGASGVLYGCSADGDLFSIDPDTGDKSPLFNADGLALSGLASEPGCQADCDASGSLDILDFVCFQAKFVDADPGADCDGNGRFDILDFVCFQQLFVAGCD